MMKGRRLRSYNDFLRFGREWHQQYGLELHKKRCKHSKELLPECHKLYTSFRASVGA